MGSCEYKEKEAKTNATTVIRVGNIVLIFIFVFIKPLQKFNEL